MFLCFSNSSVSSVANYMALQELSFVSLGQRVLNNPLAIRQHYGHPDVFDKIFIMTEGGNTSIYLCVAATDLKI